MSEAWMSIFFFGFFGWAGVRFGVCGMFLDLLLLGSGWANSL